MNNITCDSRVPTDDIDHPLASIAAQHAADWGWVEMLLT
jgi:hypothetical protein